MPLQKSERREARPWRQYDAAKRALIAAAATMPSVAFDKYLATDVAKNQLALLTNTDIEHI
jgi:hypothetical protein